jgi:hypothetical protein
VLAGSASAVIPYYDGFDEAPGTNPLDGGYWTVNTDPCGLSGSDYTGTGHYRLTSDSGLEAPGLATVIGTGDFTVTLDLDNYVAASGTYEYTVAYDYTDFEFRVYDATQYVAFQGVDYLGTFYLKMLYYDGVSWWWGPQPTFDPYTLTDLDMRMSWTDDPCVPGGYWDLDYNLNGAGWVDGAEFAPDDGDPCTVDIYGGLGYNEDATEDRWLQFYGFGYANYAYWEISELTVDVDSYNIVPEPTSLALLGLGSTLLLRRRRS